MPLAGRGDIPRCATRDASAFRQRRPGRVSRRGVNYLSFRFVCRAMAFFCLSCLLVCACVCVRAHRLHDACDSRDGEAEEILALQVDGEELQHAGLLAALRHGPQNLIPHTCRGTSNLLEPLRTRRSWIYHKPL